MSKYHKGDKFIVEIKEVIESNNGKLYRSDFKTLTFDDNGLDKLQKYNEPTMLEDTLEMEKMKALNDGRNEVWECIKKLTVNDYLKDGYDSDELLKIFGTDNIFCILKNYTPQEALAKLEAYEKKQNEIKVGDVVCFKKSQSTEILITAIERGLCGIHLQTNEDGRKGETNSFIVKDDVVKTGKHIDIQSILQQIGGGTSES